MKELIFDPKWEEALLKGDKTAFICKGTPHKVWEELDVMVKDGDTKRHIGFSKITRIKEKKGEELDRISLYNVSVYRVWLTVANKCGLFTIQQLLEFMNNKLKIKKKDVFQVVEFAPLKMEPYGLLNELRKEGLNGQNKL